MTIRDPARESQDQGLPTQMSFGYCSGTRKDAEAIARGLIDRQFNAPEQSWYYLSRAKQGGYYFEIHEGGKGLAFLPDVLRALSERDRVRLAQANGRIVEVRFRRNQIQALLLPENEGRESGEDLSRTAPMSPFLGLAENWPRMGALVFALGGVMMAAALVIHHGAGLVASGYYEAAHEAMPLGRLIQIEQATVKPIVEIPAADNSPVLHWDTIPDLGPEEYVEKLVYEDGQWTVQVREPQQRDWLAPTLPNAPEGDRQ